jgi:hypothetical protein
MAWVGNFRNKVDFLEFLGFLSLFKSVHLGFHVASGGDFYELSLFVERPHSIPR